MEFYDKYLDDIESVIGNKSTYASTLEKAGKQLFGPDFLGVFAKDEKYPQNGEYAIVNTHRRDEPGEHWMAVGKGMLYDSFGRRGMLGGGLQDTELDAEQNIVEENCGQRCLAWLCVLDNHGIDAALEI